MVRLQKYQVKLVRESSLPYETRKVNSSMEATDIIKDFLKPQELPIEKFGFICLNSSNDVVGVHIPFSGSVNITNIFIRDIITRVLLNNAVSIILFHNHPGNSTSPSSQDITTTDRIKKACELMEIKLLDHFIFTDNSYLSFAEKGLM